MLDVVQQDQHSLGGEDTLDRLLDRLLRKGAQVDGLSDRGWDRIGMLERRERDEHRTVGELRVDGARNLGREAGLSDSARAGECE